MPKIYRYSPELGERTVRLANDNCQDYNPHRLHSTLDYKIPEEFTLNWPLNNPGLRKIPAR